MNYDSVDAAAAFAALVGSDAQSELSLRLGQSLELTDALWDLVPVVVAAGEHHDRVSPAEVADASASGRRLNENVRSRLREVAQQWAETAYSTLDATWDESAAASLTPTEVIANPFGALASVVDIPSVATQLMSAMAGARLTSTDELFYFMSYLRAIARLRRTPLLLRALSVTAISTIEPLVTRMVHLLVHHTDPRKYESLADPNLDKEARRLCNGPPDRWRKTLVDTFGITKLADTVDWNRLGLLWEDRNAIAHRGAVVDARHSSKSGAEVGTVLNPGPDEVQATIDDIGAARYGTVIAVWNHLEPDMCADLASATEFSVLESLRAGRWRQAEGLGRVQQALATDPEAEAAAKVNRWIALDQGLGAKAIHDQVQAWEVASLPNRFEMARQILLRRDDEGLRLLQELLSSGELSPTDVAEWPLFDRLREEGRLSDIRGYGRTVNEASSRTGPRHDQTT